MCNRELSKEWDIYLVAGVGSAPATFHDCKSDLQRRFGAIGREPVIRDLFPYGDHTRNLMRQILQVRGDVSRLRRTPGSGAQAAAREVRAYSTGRPVLLIGHSGGGAAAYRAAVMLSDEGVLEDFRIVQVGSPRVPVRPEFRDKVSYFLAVDEHGNLRDPITRLGGWGGWSRGRLGAWYWNKQKYAPGHIGTITVLGGHEHYFRSKAPYVHPERGSNLTRTLDTIFQSPDFRL